MWYIYYTFHIDILGLPSEMREAYRNAVSYYVFDIKDDQWTVKNGAEAFPGQEKQYTFTVGKPFDADMLDGSTFQVNTLSMMQELENKCTPCEWLMSQYTNGYDIAFVGKNSHGQFRILTMK